jgi:DNA-binding MarR family transcriptional regulator
VILAVIRELNERGPSVTQNDVSGFSMIDVMTVSTTLRLLEKKELVVRENHPSDTRAKRILNTERGDRVLEAINPVVESVDGAFFSDSEERIASFMALLRQLKDGNAAR